jgi:peptide/nickel transport system ATP-binding protein
MSFAQPEPRPAKHLARIGFVVLLHIVLIWGLMNGLVAVMRQGVVVETVAADGITAGEVAHPYTRDLPANCNAA